jgi:hypothetical protein
VNAARPLLQQSKGDEPVQFDRRQRMSDFGRIQPKLHHEQLD